MEGTVLGGFFAAWRGGNLEELLALVDADAEFIAARPEGSPDISLYGTYRGHDGVRRFIATLGDVFEPQRFTVDKVLEDGTNSVAWGHLTHRVRATGRLFDSAWATVCDLKDGRIARYRFYEDTAALHAAFGVGY